MIVPAQRLSTSFLKALAALISISPRGVNSLFMGVMVMSHRITRPTLMEKEE